jgi:hypothetical protein
MSSRRERKMLEAIADMYLEDAFDPGEGIITGESTVQLVFQDGQRFEVEITELRADA